MGEHKPATAILWSDTRRWINAIARGMEKKDAFHIPPRRSDVKITFERSIWCFHRGIYPPRTGFPGIVCVWSDVLHDILNSFHSWPS
ncbi:hypothetical protein AVEN_250926-1 [Araneus ventricosus]|uniref:Uncharacterized protein n=1 Tax=Araneus ventricosus TaxID=182803 RepID=A0A4Y2W3Z7_ARAVE|nr:hypothetical protein AVEN_250926-1 [Araneus ventricosus]